MKLSLDELEMLDEGLAWIIDQSLPGEQETVVPKVNALRERLAISKRATVAAQKNTPRQLAARDKGQPDSYGYLSSRDKLKL